MHPIFVPHALLLGPAQASVTVATPLLPCPANTASPGVVGSLRHGSPVEGDLDRLRKYARRPGRIWTGDDRSAATRDQCREVPPKP